MAVRLRHRANRWTDRNLHVLIMCYIDKPLFMIRTSKSHWYKGASGTSGATPKLYSQGHAEAQCRRLNKGRVDNIDGFWEVVPVGLNFGEPYVP